MAAESTALRLPAGYAIGAMTRAEAGLLFDWAAAEGWNPGLADLDVAWDFDPEAFIALRRSADAGTELVGGGAILSYRGQCGFMGLFIMRADHRRRGLGRVLWHERLHRLQSRLRPGAFIGMDGVFDMAPFYAAGGFEYLHRDLRFQGVADGARLAGAAMANTAPLSALPFAAIDAYDRDIFGRPRTDFLRRWLGVRGGFGLAALDGHGDRLHGYGFLRPCVTGYKLGPVFADDAATARALVRDLLSRVPGETVALDVPEPNAAAIGLARDLGWSEHFGCARMVRGPRPADSTARVFGVTSFEFG